MSIHSPDRIGIGENLFSDCYDEPNTIACQQKDGLFEASGSPVSKPKVFLENQGSPSSERREFPEKSASPNLEMKDLENISISPEQKEQFLETIFNEKNGYTTGKTEDDFLPPVPPGSSGEGLPYAPVDWPNRGDVWSWKVGKRINSSGFHIDRSVNLPNSLQKPKCPKQFASKSALEHFIQAQLPGADIDAFFKSFTWKIPASKEHQNLAEVTVHPKGDSQGVEEDDVKKESSERTLRASGRKRKQPEFLVSGPRDLKKKPADLEKSTTKSDAASAKSGKQGWMQSKQKSTTGTKTPKQQTRRRSIPSASDKTDGEADMSLLNGEAANNVGGNQDLGLHIYVSPQNGVITCHSPIELVEEEFDNYLNSLDEILDQPISGDQPAQLEFYNSDTAGDQLHEARAELSALLNQDIPSLICSKDLTKLTSLASKLRSDPILTAEQLVMLKLIEEIPSFSAVFTENKEIVDKADSFFQAHEANKAKVASLRKEYNDLKDQTVLLESEVDYSILSVGEIDKQIAQLQVRRADLTKLIESKKKEQSELAYNQKLVGNAIPKVVNEVQIANSKKQEWEMKKEGALKREAEMLNRFVPLRGHSLWS